ncbi:NADH dehydrogenase [ubiquinone] 1 alpha subcomplex subunit 7-like isoform X1 [Centruroides sculpturatus]|uniref:NADH dehydrogenase [ubiquinone] 1 alpha subcomplex subunit 7-like isoform X1 n=1 Tax=Centruroides sculpturatus TaxID=218467 RepID=UPI000C6E2C54|nr:NADH dehydrogenase [ubiquinone] 1 alpha subcomplex subunit 7-like isoform X1 [Centruroides sculpturatus]
MTKVQPRDVSPILQMLRNFLLGRSMKNALRFQDYVATRSPPMPNLPEGPSHKLSSNYYYTRDGRRESRPPLELTPTNMKSIASEKSVTGKPKPLSITPGKGYVWKKVESIQ